MAALTACRQEAAAPTDSALLTAASESAPDFALGAEKHAKWQSYQCHDGSALSVRYFNGQDGKPAAEIRFDRKLFKLSHNSEYSNQDLTAFSGKGHTWTVSNTQKADI